VEFDGGGVAEGVEDAEEEVGGDVGGVAAEDGGDAGAGGGCLISGTLVNGFENAEGKKKQIPHFVRDDKCG
jgi:hypothetical protein